MIIGGITMEWKYNSVEKYICIVLDQNAHLLYSNIIKHDYCESLIEELFLDERIKGRKPRKEIYKDYFINIDEVLINKEPCYVAIIESINEDAHVENLKLNNLVYKDFSTGVYNRNMWEHIITGEANMGSLEYFSVAVIDVDDLKKVNDKIGHVEGDIIIKEVANSILKIIRREDIAIRYGGDEFLIIFPGMEEKSVLRVIGKIKKHLYSSLSRIHKKIDISVGVSEGRNLRELLDTMEQADFKMYKQKREKKHKRIWRIKGKSIIFNKE